MEPPLPPLPELLEHSFCKTLTPSDTNIHGGFSVFNRHADACFPPLVRVDLPGMCNFVLCLRNLDVNYFELLVSQDMSRQPPKQELVARDLHGNEWRFEHVFKGNNINLNNELLYFIFDSHEDWDARSTTKALAYKRLEGFLSSKRPVAGDAFVFLRLAFSIYKVIMTFGCFILGGNGQLRVGLRRALRPQGNVPSIINSSPGMFDEVLSAAWEAFTRRTLFTISYKPRTSPAEFVVPVDQYMESMRRHYTIGMRFQMRFESEEAPEHRFSGAIVGIEDADPIKWPGSKWRCLKDEFHLGK
ncbi:Auxin response factor domain - like 1 [Theobroma cacao]|nr:Auxin response factor domain - like 1 [Theobroma cacao]